MEVRTARFFGSVDLVARRGSDLFAGDEDLLDFDTAGGGGGGCTGVGARTAVGGGAAGSTTPTD